MVIREIWRGGPTSPSLGGAKNCYMRVKDCSKGDMAKFLVGKEGKEGVRKFFRENRSYSSINFDGVNATLKLMRGGKKRKLLSRTMEKSIVPRQVRAKGKGSPPETGKGNGVYS